jgi:hypothetical protein
LNACPGFPQQFAFGQRHIGPRRRCGIGRPVIVAAALALTLQPVAAQGRTIDWATLAPLPLRTHPAITPDMLGFVAGEIALRKCPIPAGPGQTLTIDVAVLVAADDGIRTAIPRAIRCPTIEQYAAALVASAARNNLLPRSATSEQWYRASVTFEWPR